MSCPRVAKGQSISIPMRVVSRVNKRFRIQETSKVRRAGSEGVHWGRGFELGGNPCFRLDQTWSTSRRRDAEERDCFMEKERNDPVSSGSEAVEHPGRSRKAPLEVHRR